MSSEALSAGLVVGHALSQLVGPDQRSFLAVPVGRSAAVVGEPLEIVVGNVGQLNVGVHLGGSGFGRVSVDWVDLHVDVVTVRADWSEDV